MLGDEGIRETCFKALYAGLVRASRNTNVHTLVSINLMKNSCAETLGLQGMEKVGYIVGFGSIRQLAVHLRNSITNNAKVCSPICALLDTEGKRRQANNLLMYIGVLQDRLQLAICSFP